MLEGTVSALLFKDASHSSMEETSPEPLRLWVLVRDESDLENCVGAEVCWINDRAPVPRII